MNDPFPRQRIHEDYLRAPVIYLADARLPSGAEGSVYCPRGLGRWPASDPQGAAAKLAPLARRLRQAPAPRQI